MSTYPRHGESTYVTKRRTFVAVVIAAAAVVAGGCGGSGDARRIEDTSPTTAPSQVPQVKVAPGPDAIAARREHELLLDAYAPVAEHVNDLVSAKRLHALKMDERGDLVTAAVAYRNRVRAARSAVVGIRGLTSAGPVRVQMLTALDTRLESIGQLIAWARAEQARPAAAEWLLARHDDSWNASAGAARAALNRMQADRKRLGLPYVQEDSIR